MMNISQNPEIFRQFRQCFDIFDNAGKDGRNCRMCTLSISSTIPADLQFWHFRQFTGIIEHRCFRYLRQFRQIYRNCRKCRKLTIPPFSGDTNSAGIVEALPELPGLSKISWFWICMDMIQVRLGLTSFPVKAFTPSCISNRGYTWFLSLTLQWAHLPKPYPELNMVFTTFRQTLCTESTVYRLAIADQM